MTPTTVRPRLLHSLDIIQHLSPEIILDIHLGKHGREIEDLLVGELAHSAGRVDVKAREEARGDIVADPEEGLDGFLGVVVSSARGWCGGIGGVLVLALTRFRSGKLKPRMKTCFWLEGCAQFQLGIEGEYHLEGDICCCLVSISTEAAKCSRISGAEENRPATIFLRCELPIQTMLYKLQNCVINYAITLCNFAYLW